MSDLEPIYYRVRVDVGPHSWTIERGDAPDYGPTDDLVVGWKLPENAAWPTQPEMSYARFGVIVADAADFQADIGDPVALWVWEHPEGTPLPAGYTDPDGLGSWLPVAVFAGRVTELEAATHGLGVLYRVSCLDYLVDAAELAVSADDDTGWPGEDIEDRLTRITDLADDAFVSVPWDLFEGPETGWGVFWPNAAPETKGSLDHVVEHLAQYVYFGHFDPPIQGGARGILIPNIPSADVVAAGASLVPDPSRRYDIAWAFRTNFNRQAGLYLPAQLRPSGPGGTWRPTVDPDQTELWDGSAMVPVVPDDVPAQAIGILPARAVDFPASWLRVKRARAETVRVETVQNWADIGGRTWIVQSVRDAHAAEPINNPTVKSTVKTELGYAEEARTLARFLVPEPAQTALRWEADGFRVWADQVPDRLTKGNSATWFHPISWLYSPMVCIGDIPEQLNPNATVQDYYYGLLSSAEFHVKDGRYWVDFTLSRELPRPASGTSLNTTGAITGASMALDQPTVAWDDLDPSITWYDTRAIRRG